VNEPYHAHRDSASILYVEDHPSVRKVSKAILQMEGYKVAVASDGQEALDMLTESDFMPDLIISDIAMPRMNGFELLHNVRSITRLNWIPFIFVTASSAREDVFRGRQLGVDEYITKPIEAQDLVVTVRNKLKRSSEQRMHAEEEMHRSQYIVLTLLSHELRTPLTHIKGGYDWLTSVIDENDPLLHTSVDLIGKGIRRLSRVSDQAIRYSELTSGYAQHQLAHYGRLIPLDDEITTAVHSVEHEYAERGIHLIQNTVESGMLICSMQGLLASALYEVLRNAAMFSPPDSTVELTLRRDADDPNQGVITVRDYGCGIPQQDQEKIWSILSQSNRAKYEQQGFGMGLSIVRQTMLVHNGTAELESEVDAGTLVTLRIPVAS
jgi:two-component system, sensor histidine kinase and response regulator